MRSKRFYFWIEENFKDTFLSLLYYFSNSCIFWRSILWAKKWCTLNNYSQTRIIGASNNKIIPSFNERKENKINKVTLSSEGTVEITLYKILNAFPFQGLHFNPYSSFRLSYSHPVHSQSLIDDISSFCREAHRNSPLLCHAFRLFPIL